MTLRSLTLPLPLPFPRLHGSTKGVSGSPLASLVLMLGVGILAFDPLLWLASSWFEPAYDSKGSYVFALTAALFAWSASSPSRLPLAPRRRLALGLLGATALIRLLGQVLAVNTIGALALAIDVYALGLLLALDWRQRPVSPFFLAAAFAFSLPLERIVQRSIGYLLQLVSAEGACGLLGVFSGDVECRGVRILYAGHDVLVDLPCSGARTLLLLLFGFLLIAALVRPSWKQALAGLGLALGAGLAANILRIALLAVGISRPELVFGIDVMTAPWHDLIGLFALGLALLPLTFWARHISANRPQESIDTRCRHFIPQRLAKEGWWLNADATPKSRHSSVALAFGLLVLALVIVSLPRRALDVARGPFSIDLPQMLMGARATEIPLMEGEAAYFTRYGGAAKKGAYGPLQLLVVSTSAPLRHLHAPEDCLRGMGFSVRYLGMQQAPLPSAIYEATGPEGKSWRIKVSFVSDKGEATSNVAEAVWRWLQAPGSNWRAIQRISPADFDETIRAGFDEAVTAALDLPRHP